MSPEPLTLRVTGPSEPRLTADRHRELADRAKLLSWVSLAWMSVEGGVAILAGILAGSVALIGFGIDSAIEGLASGVIIWRFTGARVFSDTPRRAPRSSWRSSSSSSPRTSATRRRPR